MSYRTFKRLLGETSLERKCRLLFGGGLLLLISGSFYFYSKQTQQIIFDQNDEVARMQMTNAIMAKHSEYFLRNFDENRKKSFAAMLKDLKPESQKNQSWALLKPDSKDHAPRPVQRPTSPQEYTKLPADGKDHEAIRILAPNNKAGKREWTMRLKDPPEYRFYAQVLALESCLVCHRQHNRDVFDPDKGDALEAGEAVKVGDVLGIVKISYPLAKINRDLSWNNAVLLATAILTTAMAWMATYVIVRYVIVKPVLHLKEVSDSITRGDLDQRADIRTGDEFEELSQAFNRMLRHLTTVQEDLQKLNRGFQRNVDELAQANLRLFELNNLKNEFLATMSHELRTPLNSILGFSDVLLTNPGNLTEKQQRYVAHIRSSGRTLMSLITDVLDLAKIESGKMELRPVEMSVTDLVERVVGAMMPLAERKNIDLGWDVDPDVPVAFQDLGKLQQILNNLLSNAIKFTPEGGRVRVRASQRQHNLVLVVEDTGIGIPLEDQERIFEKFRQGSTTAGERDPLTREFEGTGLGLSITRELSKLLGGGIGLQSEFGKGSRFTIVVPLRIVVPLEADPTKPRPVSEAIDLVLERPSAGGRVRLPKTLDDPGRSSLG
ncbi:sensor histidine kinase [Schlesneria paludicola]|uniref:sensor histidine kinase n=1 Tax=Schlesneria paludicola TaxID=360056 RepID=UPI00029B1138|nr:ATP-binding protein [Schlesneria paludicola]